VSVFSSLTQNRRIRSRCTMLVVVRERDPSGYEVMMWLLRVLGP
jgi:hypothetical protein